MLSFQTYKLIVKIALVLLDLVVLALIATEI